MKKSIQQLSFLSVFILAIFTFQGCSEESSITEPITEIKTQTPFELYLTDCPFEAEEVNVEIIGVVLEDKDGVRETLTTESGIFNLLNFTDGIDVLLAYGNISLDNLKIIYIELGGQNTIVVDGETFPLDLVEDNIVKINVDLDRLDQVEFLVDFFACTSIIENANGFFLKPVIKFIGDRDKDVNLVEDLIEGFEKCYELVFPISLVNKEDETVTANNRAELIEILIDNEIKDAVFPINLLNVNGNPIQVYSLADASIIKDCALNEEEDEEDDEEIDELLDLLNKLDKCYDIVFPISLLDESNNALEATNVEELIFIFESNTIENVVFPIQLIDTNGSTININEAFEIAFLDLDC